MKILALCAGLCIAGHSMSQGLVANGGFEEVNTCTEYDVECAPEAWISSSNGFANYFKEAQRAHSGMNCMAIEAAHLNVSYQRTLIRTRLLCGLRKGSRYKLELFIRSPHPLTDSAGVRFTSTDPLYEKTPLQQLSPDLYFHDNADRQPVGDSSWHHVSMLYTATGSEQFVSIGYFARNDYKGPQANPIENRYFIYLDDISLLPEDPKESLCDGWQQRKEEIYEENERHTMLDKKIYYYKQYPPDPLPRLPLTHRVVTDTLVLPDILFATGKAVLDPGSYPLLDSLCRRINSSHVDSLVVEGHTDSTGQASRNQQLSENRAAAVKAYISSHSRYNSTITRGMAGRQPVAGNNTPEGRQRNRRVEIFLYIRE